MKGKTQTSNNKKYKYVYQTKNLINGKTYVGYHCTDKLNDGYIGCGCKSDAYAKACVKKGLKSSFLRSVLKYGYSNFKKEILSFYDTVEECLEEEKFIVNEDWVNSNKNYNNKVGGMYSGTHLRKTTREEDELIFKDFMNGEYKEDICKKYNISKSVVYRITKDKDTSKRVVPKQKHSLKIRKWINENSKTYIDKYVNWEMTKEEISKITPFFLYKNNFLKGVEKNPKYVAICNESGDVYFFSDKTSLSKIPRMEGKSTSHIMPTINNLQSHSLNYKIVKYNDYKNGITSYWNKEKIKSKYCGSVLYNQGNKYVIGDDFNLFCKELNLDRGAVSEVILGKRKHHKNFKTTKE